MTSSKKAENNIFQPEINRILTKKKIRFLFLFSQTTLKNIVTPSVKVLQVHVDELLLQKRYGIR